MAGAAAEAIAETRDIIASKLSHPVCKTSSRQRFPLETSPFVLYTVSKARPLYVANAALIEAPGAVAAHSVLCGLTPGPPRRDPTSARAASPPAGEERDRPPSEFIVWRLQVDQIAVQCRCPLLQGSIVQQEAPPVLFNVRHPQIVLARAKGSGGRSAVRGESDDRGSTHAVRAPHPIPSYVNKVVAVVRNLLGEVVVLLEKLQQGLDLVHLG